MRPLRARRLYVVDGRLWVLDASQPVAAVVDLPPHSDGAPHLDAVGAGRLGERMRVVSWAAVPAAPPPPDGSALDGSPYDHRAFAFGASLWVQDGLGQPVARVTVDGLAQVVWAGGRRLLAAGPGVAWLAPDPPPQWIMSAARARRLGADAEHLAGHRPLGVQVDQVAHHTRLVRVHEDGGVGFVDVAGRVHSVRASGDAVFVEVDGSHVLLRDLGQGEDFDAQPLTRWVRLPSDAPLPALLDAPTHAVAATGVPAESPWGGALDGPWIRFGAEWQDPLAHAGLRWRAGRAPDEPDVSDEEVAPGDDAFGWFAYAPMSGAAFLAAGATRPVDVGDIDDDVDAVSGSTDDDADVFRAEHEVAVTAHRPDGTLADRWDLGVGDAAAMIPLPGSGVAVVVDRSTRADRGRGPAHVYALRPGAQPRLLLDGDLDITGHCRRLVSRPLESDSYLAQVLAGHPVPSLDEVRDPATRLVGDWPDTRLEWTFTLPRRPGLRLRRRFELFDETGQIVPDLEYADMHLMEDLATGGVPPADRAIDGVLDM